MSKLVERLKRRANRQWERTVASATPAGVVTKGNAPVDEKRIDDDGAIWF